MVTLSPCVTASKEGRGELPAGRMERYEVQMHGRGRVHNLLTLKGLSSLSPVGPCERIT